MPRIDAKKILDRIGRLAPRRILRDMDRRLERTGIPLSATEYLGITILLTIFMMPISFYLIPILLPGVSRFVGPIAAVAGVILFFLLILPGVLVGRRVSAIEQSLPDALRQMATALRAGISLESAMEEIARGGFGPLSDEFNKTLLEVRRGRPLESALIALGRRSGSEHLARTMQMVVEGMRTGASLSDVIESIASDIAETLRVKRERIAMTTMQVMFVMAAAAFAAPAAIGMVTILTRMFLTMGAQVPGLEQIPPIFFLYLLIQAVIGGLVIGIIREGSMGKGLKYAAICLVGALAVYKGATFAGSLLFKV